MVNKVKMVNEHYYTGNGANTPTKDTFLLLLISSLVAESLKKPQILQ